MKSEFQAKFLKHLVQKQQEEKGFTLIELLVVIIIIGILSAIALPSFLNQANKAKESESKQYTGSMNRTQQAYFLEKNTFSSDISLLGLGIKTDSTNYSYQITATSSSAINYSNPKNSLTLRAHAGGVQIAQTAQSEATTLATLCQSVKPTNTGAAGVGFSAATASAGPTCTTTTFENLLN
jgi:prepilin-type N-terminal cleavage/methylation domain-containing protein